MNTYSTWCHCRITVINIPKYLIQCLGYKCFLWMRIQDIYFIGHLCWCLCNCVTTVYIPCVCRWLCSSEEGVKSPGAVGPGNCESPNMGAESWTWVLLKSSKYPWPVSKFSSFNFWFFSYINAWHGLQRYSHLLITKAALSMKHILAKLKFHCTQEAINNALLSYWKVQSVKNC